MAVQHSNLSELDDELSALGKSDDEIDRIRTQHRAEQTKDLAHVDDLLRALASASGQAPPAEAIREESPPPVEVPPKGVLGPPDDEPSVQAGAPAADPEPTALEPEIEELSLDDPEIAMPVDPKARTAVAPQAPPLVAPLAASAPVAAAPPPPAIEDTLAALESEIPVTSESELPEVSGRLSAAELFDDAAPVESELADTPALSDLFEDSGSVDLGLAEAPVSLSDALESDRPPLPPNTPLPGPFPDIVTDDTPLIVDEDDSLSLPISTPVEGTVSAAAPPPPPVETMNSDIDELLLESERPDNTSEVHTGDFELLVDESALASESPGVDLPDDDELGEEQPGFFRKIFGK